MLINLNGLKVNIATATELKPVYQYQQSKEQNFPNRGQWISMVIRQQVQIIKRYHIVYEIVNPIMDPGHLIKYDFFAKGI